MKETVDVSTLKERAQRKLLREMGPELEGVLHDPSTIEIMLNADGRLWQERLGEGMRCIGTMPGTQAQRDSSTRWPATTGAN